MIAVQLGGGIGNQLFQYAAARALALRRGVGLVLDRRLFDGHRTRRFALDAFTLDARAADGEALPPAHDGLAGRLRSWLGPRPRYREFRERGFVFDPAVLALPDWTWLRGNFQSEQYFADRATDLRRDLVFRAPPDAANGATLNEIANATSVSVHIRRGDYASSPRANRVHGVIAADFYRRAAGHIAGQCGAEPSFFVFTDDPDWVAAEFDIGYRFRLVRNNGAGREAEDLRLMAACRHHILANSSFSWWGAWLDPRPDAIVIAPQRWFRDASRDVSTLIPGRWLRI